MLQDILEPIVGPTPEDMIEIKRLEMENSAQEAARLKKLPSKKPPNQSELDAEMEILQKEADVAAAQEEEALLKKMTEEATNRATELKDGKAPNGSEVAAQ